MVRNVRRKPQKLKKNTAVHPLVRPATKITTIHSPTVPGASDRVERVVDSIGFLERKFPLEHAVALRIRRAYDMIGSEVGGAGDFDRLRSGYPQAGVPPPAARLDAARLLADLDGAKIPDLDDMKRVLITLVVCQNRTLSSISKMFGAHGRDWYGTALRSGLRLVGEFWGWSERRPARAALRSERTGARATAAASPSEVYAGGVAHASGQRVLRPLAKRR